MNSDERAAVRDEVASRAEDLLASVARRWESAERIDPLEVSPLSDRDPSFPESADAFHDEFYPYAAGAVVTDEDTRLLCVYNSARDGWETPGGAGETGETPAETARREVLEETGVECELTGVLYVRTMELDLGVSETLPIPTVVFTGRPTGGEPLGPADVEAHDEISDLGWFGTDELPTELREYERKRGYLRSLSGDD